MEAGEPERMKNIQAIRRSVIQYNRLFKDSTGKQRRTLYGNYQAAKWYTRSQREYISYDEIFDEWVKTGFRYLLDRPAKEEPPVMDSTQIMWAAVAFVVDSTPILKEASHIPESTPADCRFNYVTGTPVMSSPAEKIAIYTREIVRYTLTLPVDLGFERKLGEYAALHLGEGFAKYITSALINGDGGPGVPIGVLKDEFIKTIRSVMPGKITEEDLFNLSRETQYVIRDAKILVSPKRYNEIRMGRSDLGLSWNVLLGNRPVEVCPFVPDDAIIVYNPAAFVVSKLHRLRFTRYGEGIDGPSAMRAEGSIFVGIWNPNDFLVMRL